MHCEVIAIGTELLLGLIVDGNSAWIGEQLALAGIDCYFQVKVGDNFQRIESAIRQGLQRSDAVICCGGLGPTQDDITRDVIAHVMGVEMRRDAVIADKIRQMFASRGRVMSQNNLRQADVPIGAQPMAQMPGTAPGLVCPIGAKVVYAVPGVPHEMREMVAGTVLPDLQRRAGQAAVITSRALRTWGMSESGLAEALAPRVEELDRLKNPTIAYQASGIEGIKVRIVAKADDPATAQRMLDREEALLRAVLGDVIFGIDEETMELVVLDLLRRRGLTLAAAEGLTGGLLSSRMSAADPGLACFKGARIGPEAGGDRHLPPQQRAIDAAAKVRSELGASVGLAAVAGEPEARGAVPVALAAVLGTAEHGATALLPGDRHRLRDFAVINLLDHLRKVLAA
jgi:nicotinamide-nucleotide amidase